jgi:hypothetical protein
MGVFAPRRGIPQVDECMDGEEGGAGKSGRPRGTIEREPHKRGSGDQIGGADVAHEMRVSGPVCGTPGSKSYQASGKANMVNPLAAKPNPTIQATITRIILASCRIRRDRQGRCDMVESENR